MTQQPPPPSRHPGADSYERNLQRIRLRQDTEENWLKNDPIPASGELCYTIGSNDAGRLLKVGDGSVRWSNLPYIAREGVAGPKGEPGTPGHGITVYGPQDRPPAPVNTTLESGDIWLCSAAGYPGQPAFDAKVVTPGAKGDKGDPGEAATISIGRVVSVGPTVAPQVQNSGTNQAAVFDFALQQGDKGDQGLPGIQGAPGLRGPAGETFKISGAVANAAGLPNNPPHLSVYIAKSNAHLYIYDTSSAAADPNNGYVDLGAIEGKQGEPFTLGSPVADAKSLPATGIVGQCVMTTDNGHLHGWDGTRWIDGGRVRGDAGSGIADGTAKGQVPTWDDLTHKWTPSAPPSSVPDGTATGDMLSWDEHTKSWLASAIGSGKFRGALTKPPKTGASEQVYYQIADVTLSSQPDLYPHHDGGPVYNSHKAVVWDDRMLAAMANGERPDPNNPGVPLNPNQGLVITPQTYIFEFNEINYHLSSDPDAVNKLKAIIAGTAPFTAPATGFQDLVDAGIMVPKPFGYPWNPNWLPIMSAGHQPSVSDPPHTVLDDKGNPVPLSLEWPWTAAGLIYRVVDVAGLQARIAAGETSGAQWAAGTNPPVVQVTTATVKDVKQGFYRHDGTGWIQIPSGLAVALNAPTDGQVLSYDGTAKSWVNKDIDSVSPIVFMGNGPWNNKAALDGTDPMYGMPAGTTPSPLDWIPVPGDAFIDLLTGVCTVFS